MTRFWENLGNILNGYFSRPSDFAASLVSEADKIAMPEKKVLKADSAEEQKKSALQVFKESMQRGMEASEAYDMGLSCAWQIAVANASEASAAATSGSFKRFLTIIAT